MSPYVIYKSNALIYRCPMDHMRNQNEIPRLLLPKSLTTAAAALLQRQGFSFLKNTFDAPTMLFFQA